jgi:hypothetical protein
MNDAYINDYKYDADGDINWREVRSEKAAPATEDRGQKKEYLF